MKPFRNVIPSLNRQRAANLDDNGTLDHVEAEVSHEVLGYHSFRPGSGLLGTMSSSGENPPCLKDYRGFNTSIADMWRYPEQERIDCCSIACFGCLQADRDRYLITGVKPPTFCRRICAHLIMPICIFGLAIFAAVNIPDPYTNQLTCYCLVFTFVMYFFSQCLKGAWKRRQVRRDLLWAKFHKRDSGRFRRRRDEESDDEDYGDEDYYFMGQTRSDICNAHSLCGCYATDRGSNFVFGADEEITFCTRIFDCFTNICFNKICGMHLVCCGFCGVAQEGREIEALLRPEMLHIDYVTMQPMMEYYPAIYEARHSDERPKSRWYNRLSSFSRWTLINTFAFLAVAFLWSVLSGVLNHNFGPKNYLVFLLTLLHTFILLALVYAKHKKDVSIDAVIKFFAAGFCLSTTLGVFFELAVGLVIRLVMGLIIAVSGVDVVQENGYSMQMSGLETTWTSGQEINYVGVNYRAYVEAFGNDHPFIYTFYLFITSFMLAAMIEEVCKYFGYRMVDHPDFHSREQMEEAMKGQEEDGMQQTATSFANQDRTFQSRGAAITVSMVAVGSGFACCENLVYIFIYGGSTLTMQVFILIARSLFPIHPIAAALQSIGVCKRDLERDPKARLGRIVFPAITFHGIYDFSLVWFYYLANRKGSYVDQHDTLGVTSSVISAAILLGGICYYFREARKQRQRLAAMDGVSAVDPSRLT
jgi:RsiW-degrading membrane proteinase PrsW (M82 family)